jgi:hypothetical protein
MWETAMQVEREQAVDANPGEVWALLGNLAALSAMPARFAFGVPAALAGTDRLCGLLVVAKTMTCAVLDVRQEIPGQMICWQTRSTQPAGRQSFTLSVLPQPHGSVVRIAARDVVPRQSKIGYEKYWRTELRAWLDRLRAVAEGRIPWPETGMPADLQRACSTRPPLKRPERVSATVLINAPVGPVWEAVWAPDTVRIIDPEHVAHAGHVPGTPQREVGEMQYFVRGHARDRFTAAVHLVTELAEERSAVTRHIGPPHDETHHLFTPVPGGTRLELACRWSAHGSTTGGKNTAASMAKNLQEMADGYKTLIEKSAG